MVSISNLHVRLVLIGRRLCNERKNHDVRVTALARDNSGRTFNVHYPKFNGISVPTAVPFWSEILLHDAASSLHIGWGRKPHRRVGFSKNKFTVVRHEHRNNRRQCGVLPDATGNARTRIYVKIRTKIR